MRLWLNPAKMSEYGVAVADVLGAVQVQNQRAAAGSIGLNPAPSTAIPVFDFGGRPAESLKNLPR